MQTLIIENLDTLLELVDNYESKGAQKVVDQFRSEINNDKAMTAETAAEYFDVNLSFLQRICKENGIKKSNDKRYRLFASDWQKLIGINFLSKKDSG